MTDTLDELEAIRERHEEAEHDNNSNWATDHGAQAHFDRETLLRLLDAAREDVDRLEAALAEIKRAAQDFVDLSLPRPSPTSSLAYQAAHATRLAILRAALKEQTP